MQTTRRTLTLGATLAVTAALCGCSAFHTDDADPTAASRSSEAAAASSAAQASPGAYGTPVNPSLPNPTAVATDAPVTSAPTTGSSSGGGAGVTTVTVVVTYSGWEDSSSGVEVGAYAVGVAETGGSCTLTLTRNGQSVSAQSSAEADASSTSRLTLSVPGSELTSGTWRAVVEYASGTSGGTSDPVDVVVP